MAAEKEKCRFVAMTGRGRKRPHPVGDVLVLLKKLQPGEEPDDGVLIEFSHRAFGFWAWWAAERMAQRIYADVLGCREDDVSVVRVYAQLGSPPELACGDRVRLRSGGPEMVVIHVGDDEALCAWFNPGTEGFQHREFKVATLDKVERID